MLNGVQNENSFITSSLGLADLMYNIETEAVTVCRKREHCLAMPHAFIYGGSCVGLNHAQFVQFHGDLIECFFFFFDAAVILTDTRVGHACLL